MPGLLERLLGPLRGPRDYRRAPEIAGLDAIAARCVELQRAYWTPDPEELAAIEARADESLSWAQRLRAHHLRCLALLDQGGHLLRRALLAPVGERPAPAELAAHAERNRAQRGKLQASARLLLGRRSPFRPRHGFAWLGEGPPAGDAVPYSDHQGRALVGALTHLGSLEVVRLDEQLEPAAIDFVAFDDILTIARGRTDPTAPFVPARILREHSLPELVVLLPVRHGLSWFAHEADVVRGRVHHRVAAIELGGLADPGKAAGNPLDRRPLGICAGAQQLEMLSDYDEEGLARFELGACYQLSLAIDQDDPRFADKCRGRGLDPEATRGDVVRESRLRASARAARKPE